MSMLRSPNGRPRRSPKHPATRRRLHPTPELLEDRIAPATGGGSYFLQAQLTTSKPAEWAQFGRSVSLSDDGESLAVGSSDLGTYGQHRVELFTRSDRRWEFAAEFVPPEGADAYGTFGKTIALSGDADTLAVAGVLGSDQNDPVTLYVYVRSGSDWHLRFMATMPGGGGLGSNLSISDDGSVIAAGASSTDVGEHTREGVVYVFSRTDGDYSQSAVVSAPEPGTNVSFGGAIGLSGDGETLIATSLRPNVEGGEPVVHILERSESGWELGETLASPGFGYGGPVAIDGDGDMVLVGTVVVSGDSRVGAERVFERSGESWTPTADLLAPEGTTFEGFGTSLGLDDDGATAVVGASYATVDGVESRGAAYVFSRSGSTWSYTDKLTAFDGDRRDRFGAATAIGGRTIAVGVSGVDYGPNFQQGAAYVFSSPEGFAVTVDPVSQTAQYGTMVTLTASATGATDIDVRWQVSADDGATWDDVAGATNSWYTLYASFAASGNQYRAVFTDGEGAEVVTHPAVLQVVKAASAVVVAPTPAPVVAGTPFTINVDVVAADPNLRGPADGWIVLTLSLFERSTGESSVVYSHRQYFNSQPECFSIPDTLPAGSYVVTAAYDGSEDPWFDSSTGTASQFVMQDSSTIEASIAPSAVTDGNVVVIYATVLRGNGGSPPTGAVRFMDNGETVGYVDVQPLSTSAGAAFAMYTNTSLAIGDHYFQMVYLGDSSVSASGSDVYRVVVEAPPDTMTTTTLTSDGNPSITGNLVVFVANVAGEAGVKPPAGGIVDFSIGGVLIASSAIDGDGRATLGTDALIPGTYPVTARYRGGDRIATSESPPLFQVVLARVDTTTSLTSNRNLSRVGDALTFTATVAGADGKAQLWSGDVDFFVGDQLVATVPVDVQGEAEVTTSALIAGTYSLTARYRGAGSSSPSRSEEFIQAVNTTTTTLSSTPNPSTSGEPATFTATVAFAVGEGHPTSGVVEYSIDGVLVASSAVDGDGKATLVTSAFVPGVYTIVAVYRGADDALGSASNSLPLAVVAPPVPPAPPEPPSLPPSPPAVEPDAPISRRDRLRAFRTQLAAARADRLAALAAARRWALEHRRR